MEVRFVLTLDEYTEGYRALLRSSTMQYRVASWIYSWPGAAVGLCLIGYGLWVVIRSQPRLPLSGILIVVCGAVLVVLPFRLRSMLRRLHRVQELEREIQLTVGPEGLQVRRAMRDAETRYGWSAIGKSGESKNLILIYPNKVQFLPVPKRALTPAQADELRMLIASNVGQRITAAGR
jgi:YcxB-like protein